MSNASVNTVFAGESNPHSEHSLKGTVIALGFIGAVAAPFVLISGLIVWACFSWLKIKRSVIISFIAIYTAILILLIPLVNVFAMAIESYTVALPNILKTGTENLTGNIIGLFLMQLPASLIVGGLLGLAYASWRWFHRAKWEEVTFRLTPIQWFVRKKNIKDIKNNLNTPQNGMTLGIAQVDGRRIVQTDRQAAAHTLVIGASGTGKTTTLLNIIRDMINRSHPVLVVDMKGSKDLAKDLHALAKREGKTFRHWSMHPQREKYTGPSELGPAYYDPIARGEASRRKDLLVEINEWSEPYYKLIAEEYLQKAFTILVGNPRKDISTLEDLSTLLDPKVLLERALPLSNDPSYRSIIADLERMNDEKPNQQERSALGTLRMQMQLLTESVTGPWLKKDPQGTNNINLFEAAHKGEIILFTLDSQNYGNTARSLGDLIIQDLKTVASELRDTPAQHPFHIIIDEFSAIGSDNIIGLISKSRDAGMPTYLSTQALGDLKKVDGAFLEQLLGIINSFFIHRANLIEDAEVYAGLTGTTVRKKFRQSVEHEQNFFGLGRGSGSGSGTLVDEEEYKVTVSEIQELGTGQMVYVSKSEKILEMVQVIPEESNLRKEHVPTPGPVIAALQEKPAIDDYLYPDDLSDDEVVKTGIPAPIIVKPANKENLERIFKKPLESVSTKTSGIAYEKKNLPPHDTNIQYSQTTPNLDTPIIPKPNTIVEDSVVDKPKTVKLPPRKPANTSTVQPAVPSSQKVPSIPKATNTGKTMHSLPKKNENPKQKDKFDF